MEDFLKLKTRNLVGFYDKHRFFSRLFLFSVTFGVLFFVPGIYLDPDFGWHLRVGEIIVAEGKVPEIDPFSYTMPSFPFISHEWITDVYLFKVHSWLGMKGLSLIFSLYLFLTLWISASNRLSRKVDKKVCLYGLVFILPPSLMVFVDYFGIRPQVQSWLLFSILFYVLFNPRVWDKYKLWLIPFVILWTNLHGSFAAGVITTVVFIFLRWLRTKEVNRSEILLAAFLISATFINPYGPRIWEEIWMSVSDSQLRWTIAEWRPAIFNFSPALLITSSISTFALAKYRNKFLLEEKAIFVLFLVQSISSTRHVPLWLLLQTPFFIVGIDYFYKEIKSIPMASERLARIYKIFLAAALLVFALRTYLLVRSARSYSVSDRYPVAAVSYLRENLPEGNMFNPYNWGGYLIWEFPEKKVFIDGRMPSWRWQGGVDGESDYVMHDYKQLLRGDLDYKEQFDKYDIQTVLWFTPAEPDIYQRMDEIALNFLDRFWNVKNDNVGLIEAIREDGWDVVYGDNTAIIYQKP